MKIARTALLMFALVGSFGPPAFFLAVRQFHWEDQTAQWMVSIWPRSLGEVALEDRRAAADMAVTYGELAAADMIIYSAIMWGGIFLFRRIFGRAGARDASLRSE
jgi:hypothetical protein